MKYTQKNQPITDVELDFLFEQRDQVLQRDGSKLVINVAGKMNDRALDDMFQSLSSGGHTPRLITSLERLYTSFRRRGLDAAPLNRAAIIACRKRISDVISAFTHWEQVTWLPSSVDVWDPIINPHTVRWGNVEMRLLESYIWNKKGLLQIARQLALELKKGHVEIRPLIQGPDRWYSSSDLRFNIQSLMTNAGFLLPTDPDEAAKDLAYFCETYLEELCRNGLFLFTPAYGFFLGTLEYFRVKLRLIPKEVKFPDAFEFYKLIEGRKILISTPFADEINYQFNSGQIFDLYKNHSMPRFEIKALTAPMSVYPRRPSESWSTEFHRHCNAIDTQLGCQNYDMYIASSGCYGIPLCGHVRKNHNIATMYCGNEINTLMGITQNCSANFMQSSRNENAWIRGTLSERYPELKNIDGGRYS